MSVEPQDHQKKKSKNFTFTAGGQSYTLPPISESTLNGGDYEDAVLAGEIGLMAWMVKSLRSVGASPEALAALRKLPQSKYAEILNEWGTYGDGDGASLGE